jgi:hypothetical protein
MFEQFCFLGYNAVWFIESQPTFLKHMSPPSAFTLVSCSAYYLAQKMEVTCFSRTSADSQLTTQRYIPENRNIHNHGWENLKSYIHNVWFQVQGTNDFNTVSKCSMVKSGYFRDDFVSYFVTRCSRRTPLIHLGYYMRVLTVDYTLQSFLNSILGQPAQVSIQRDMFQNVFVPIWAAEVTMEVQRNHVS